jgi:hypothetical protein
VGRDDTTISITKSEEVPTFLVDEDIKAVARLVGAELLEGDDWHCSGRR